MYTYCVNKQQGVHFSAPLFALCESIDSLGVDATFSSCAG